MPKFKEDNVHIFLVDEDPLLRKILEKKFKDNFQYELKSFANGETFLRHLALLPTRRNKLKIVILDDNTNSSDTKQKDTFEIIKYIKDINVKVHIIILSSYITDTIEDRARLLGVDACIKKNENSFLRIQNTIYSIISQSYIKRKHSKYQLTLLVFMVLFIVVFLIGFLNYLSY